MYGGAHAKMSIHCARGGGEWLISMEDSSELSIRSLGAAVQ